MNPFRTFLQWPAAVLVEFGLLEQRRSERIISLSWPRMVTGFARVSQEVADFVMIGLVLGPTALAGMTYASAYWMVANSLSLGLSGGTITQVSHEYGAGSYFNIDLAVKQSLWVALALGSTIAGVYLLFTEPLIRLFSTDNSVVGPGITYLEIMAVGIAFEFVNKVLSRASVGADDAMTPMVIRATGGILNIFFNIIFIFVFELGVFGAGLGTVLATLFVTGSFGVVLLTGIITSPFRLRVGRPFLDTSRIRNLISLSAPLMLRRLAQTVAVFPLLAMISVFGPIIVAGYEIARRIRRLASAPNWGFTLASSSLVGQELGSRDRSSAIAYALDTTRLSLFVHIVTAGIVFLFARPLSSVFVNTPEELTQVVPLVRIAAISVIGLGLDGVMTGILRGAGDTRWPFYAKFIGLYVITLPLVYIGTVTSIGVYGLYLGLVAETGISSAILSYRFFAHQDKI